MTHETVESIYGPDAPKIREDDESVTWTFGPHVLHFGKPIGGVLPRPLYGPEKTFTKGWTAYTLRTHDEMIWMGHYLAPYPLYFAEDTVYRILEHILWPDVDEPEPDDVEETETTHAQQHWIDTFGVQFRELIDAYQDPDHLSEPGPDDLDFEALADEAERGYDVEHVAGKPTRRPEARARGEAFLDEKRPGWREHVKRDIAQPDDPAGLEVE